MESGEEGPPKKQKRPFTLDEDRIIMLFILQNGAKNWNHIAHLLKNRTPKQCRERWHNHLDPCINKMSWTHQEDMIIIEKHRIYGNKWADIAKYLPGRTDTLVKNRWNATLRLRCEEQVTKKLPKLAESHKVETKLMDFSFLPPFIKQTPSCESASVF